MNNRRIAGLVAVAAAVIAIGAFVVTSGDSSNGNNLAADDGEPNATVSVDEQATGVAPPVSPVQVATAFWEAISAGDRTAALSLVDPTALDSPFVALFGRSRTLEGQFDWYEAVGWQWRLDGCADRDDGSVECTAAASNAWSEALGVEPITGTFIVRFGENGISKVTDQGPNSFISQWSPQVFEIFAEWVSEEHPDDAATMFDSSVDLNPEILDLYETNTARFVEAQEAG